MARMSDDRGPDLLVVGGGIGGAASALRAAQYGLRTAWVLGDRATRKASRSAYVLNVDNMIGVHPDIVQDRIADRLAPDQADAAERVREMHLHIGTQEILDNARARIAAEWADAVECVEDRATGATRGQDGFEVRLAGGGTRRAPFLILATGVMDRQPVIHRTRGDRDLSGIHWIFPYANHETVLYCIRCEGHLTRGRHVAVIGAGAAAAEVSLMLRERYDTRVTILTAGDPVTWDARRARLLAAYGVAVVEGRLTGIEGEEKGAVLKAFTVEGGARVEVDRALVAMGIQRVYNDLAVALGARLEDSDAPLDRRHVVVDDQAETDVEGLFAVGDMARGAHGPTMKQIYTAQEYAVRAVDLIDRRVRSRRRRAHETG